MTRLATRPRPDPWTTAGHWTNRGAPARASTAPADRVGDLDRSRTAAALGRAVGAGYLDALEYQDRLEQALVARTRGELDGLTADLPAGVLRDPDRVRRAARAGLRIHVAAALLGVLVCWVVWLAVGLGAGAWYPWPAWPTVGSGLGVAGHCLALRAVLPPGRRGPGRPELETGDRRHQRTGMPGRTVAQRVATPAPRPRRTEC